ncbi:SGNH/GDSL hydrolase family protein [Microterricola viridarii]|uniref:Lysophospholipase L1 n=1 Tax=Microterricola viridarii TaxID=412690 RepID=A0A1H1W9M1_9MICO|nr:SGNH/GDSL hydrolase family protein [Microterricola viridarii]SDS92859.1 Lysophospholipase L1 [Microterricola viridarii]
MSPHRLRHRVLDVIQLVPAAAQGWTLIRTMPRLPDAAGPQQGVVAAAAGPTLPPLRLRVIGESTAAGVGAPTQDLALSGRLADALASRTGRGVHWQVVGQNGATIRRIRHRLLPAVDGSDPDAFAADVAVIAAGANDVIGGRSTAEWEEQLRTLVSGLRHAGAGPATLVLLTGVPPFSRFPALRSPLRPYLARRAQRIDARSALVCAELGVLFIPFSERELELGADFFAEDRFHPSATGYALWAEYLAERIAVGLTETISGQPRP